MKAKAAVTVVSRFLSRVFNKVAREIAPQVKWLRERIERSPVMQLCRRFNAFSNDNLSCSEPEQKDEEKDARIQFLMSYLKEVMTLLTLGAAHVTDAMAVVQELESLGVRVAGLVLNPVESASAAHATKTGERPVMCAPVPLMAA